VQHCSTEDVRVDTLLQVGQLIPLQAAAKKYGLDRSTLHRWLQAGKLTRHRAAAGDRRTYLDLTELDRLLKVKPVKG
jgi:DNA invertase Pin-like site-specific DNA recombinase